MDNAKEQAFCLLSGGLHVESTFSRCLRIKIRGSNRNVDLLAYFESIRFGFFFFVCTVNGWALGVR